MADLVILGNGFDLSVGMKTSYKDFFSIDTPDNGRSRIISYPGKNEVRSYNYSFWDIVFRKLMIHCYKIENWYDVEDTIYQLIRVINSSNFLNHGYVFELYKSYKSKNPGQDSKSYPEGFSAIKADLAFYCEEKFRGTTVESFIGFLFNELRIFESEFSKYIEYVDSINGSKTDEAIAIKIAHLLYKGNSIRDKRAALQEDFIRASEGKPVSTNESSILSFNYTRLKDRITVFNIVNVHGLAKDGDIIFGIDDTKEIPPTSPLYKFTKTSRIMSSQQTDLKKSHQILPESIESISFYGHSLNPFDYSYFQSIFDHYDIYRSSVMLKFYYSKYKDDAKDEQLDRIIRLMKKYGSTMDNKDHGENLIHKLILENRLSLIEI